MSNARQPQRETGQRSYSAGSHSHAPHGSREISPQDQAEKMAQLLQAFPCLGHYVTKKSTVISAYPAALGIGGASTFVDTYLRPSTMIRAFRRAVLDGDKVIFAAQPLVGADLLLKYCDHQYAFPKELLWTTGGYYLPKSLETFITRVLASRGCKSQILHCYGAAEVGHTCFAAIDRFENGQPRFKKIDDRVSVHGTNSSTDGRLILKSNGAEAKTGDWISRVDDWWQITSNRIADEVCDTLESWSDYDWSRRTGYLHATRNPRTAEIVFTFQLRDSIRQGNDSDLRFHEFWQEFGGDLTSKPVWSINDGQ